MNNELRKKRVLEGIAMLEKGIDPLFSDGWGSKGTEEFLGISYKCYTVLHVNDWSDKNHDDFIKHGFKKGGMMETKVLLHNWKRFYELIKDLK
jgi:hypothetical protein